MPHQSENPNFRATPGRRRRNTGASSFGRSRSRGARGGGIGLLPLPTLPGSRRKKKLRRSI